MASVKSIKHYKVTLKLHRFVLVAACCAISMLFSVVRFRLEWIYLQQYQ